MNLISFLPAFKLLYGVPGRYATRFYPTCLTSFQLTTQLTKNSSSTTEESGPCQPPGPKPCCPGLPPACGVGAETPTIG